MTSYVLFFSLLLAFSMAENTAAINGSVVDSNKKPVSDAQIYLISEARSVATTGADGIFLLDHLNPGIRRLLVLHEGFQPWTKGIDLRADQIITLDIVLAAGIEEEFLAKVKEPRPKDLDRFNSNLNSLNEPLLCSDALMKQKQESYRFLWLRSFHNAVLIQLIHRGPGKTSVLYREFGKWNGNSYGSLIENKTVDAIGKLKMKGLTKNEAQTVLDRILEQAKEEVWEQPYSHLPTIRLDGSLSVGTDGADWTIEAIRHGKCHVVTRWSPERSDPVRRFAETLINLTGKRFYYDEMY